MNSSGNDESQLSGVDKKQAVTTEIRRYNMTNIFLLALHGAVFQDLEDTPHLSRPENGPTSSTRSLISNFITQAQLAASCEINSQKTPTGE